MIHERTKDLIQLNAGRCGCERRGERWYLCQYHDGYNDGINETGEDGQR